jgi:hypothetical protein
MRSDWATGQAHHCCSIGVNQFGRLNRAITAHEAIRRDREAGEAGMSWKIEVVVDDSGEWEGVIRCGLKPSARHRHMRVILSFAGPW